MAIAPDNNYDLTSLLQRLDKLTRVLGNLDNTSSTSRKVPSRYSSLNDEHVDGKKIISKFYKDLEDSLNEQRDKQLKELESNYLNLTNSAGETYKSIHDKLQTDLDEFDKISFEDRWTEEVKFRKEQLGQSSQEISNYKKSFYDQLKQQREDLQKELANADNEALQVKQQKEIEINNQINQQIEESNKKKNKALEAENQNSRRQQSIEDRLYEVQQSKESLQNQLDQLNIIKEVQGNLSEEQIQQQKDLQSELDKVNEKYNIIRKTVASSLTQRQRLEQFKDEIKDIQDEAKQKRLQNKIDNKEGTDAYKQREREINREEKEKTKSAQETYGFTTGGGSLIKSLVTGVSQAISGGDSGGGLVDILSSSIGSLAGPLGILVKIAQSIFQLLGSLNRIVDSGVQRAVDSQSAYLGQINARLYGMKEDTRNYYNEMIDWSGKGGDFGLAVGQWNATADRQVYIQKLNDLVQSGIAYNAEERAMLATISDRLVTTFDVMDATLTRLVKIQQLDVTSAALGSEALLTKFLNAQSWITDTSYLSDMYDSVSSILLDAMAKLSADEANAFNYEVQKWLGSLYSLGLSQQGVQQLAQGITYLQTGDVSNLSQNQQLQYIYAAAADRAGISLGDVLVSGLDIETTNLLLQNVVTLLQDIYNNSEANTVQSAWTNITGMSISDLRAISNVSTSYLASIANEHQTYASSLNEADYQLNMLSTEIRTGIAQAIDNIINNALLGVGEDITQDKLATNLKTDGTSWSILNNEWTLAGAINDALGIGGMNKYVVYRLGQTVGGTVGNIVQSMVTIPSIIKEITEFAESQSSLAGSSSIYSDGGKLSKLTAGVDARLIDSISHQRNIMDEYYNQYDQYITDLLSRQSQNNNVINRSQSNVSESAVVRNMQAALEMEQVLQQTTLLYNDYLSRNGVITANDINNLTTAIDSSSTQLQAASESSYSSTLESFESKATQISAAAQTISNQSEEDQQALSKVRDVEDYLFQNERTVRVTLVDLEEPAEEFLNHAPEHSDVYRILTQMLERMTLTGVQVDVIENDMNLKSWIDAVKNY